MTKSMRVAAVVLLLPLAAACSPSPSPSGGSGAGPLGSPSIAAPSTAGPSLPPACSALYRPGQRIGSAKTSAGCADPSGGVQMVGMFRCGDGRQLVQVDAATGAPAGWGFVGDVYHASANAAADPAYRKAYEKCVG